MRSVIQRVRRASVEVDGVMTGTIGKGLLIFLGIFREDSRDDLEWLAAKVLQMRIFPDDEGKLNRSVTDIEGEILLISQFTLFGNLRKGTRPSFNRAAAPDLAKRLYEEAAATLGESLNKPVATGVFGAHMEITSEQTGPVTMILDSRERGF